jgi:hypothetical protein
MEIFRIQFPRKPGLAKHTSALLCLMAASVLVPGPAAQGALVKRLSERDHYEPIVERNPFLPFFREEPAPQEEVEPPKPEPPADDREFYLQGIVRFRDGSIRAAVSEKDGQPTRLLKEGETQNATPESGLNDAIKMDSIDPDEKKVTIVVGGKSYTLSADGNKAELSKTQISRAKQIEQRQQAEAARPNNPNLRRSPQPPGSSNNNMAAELARRRAERLQRLRELRESGQLDSNAPPPPSPPSFQGRGGPPSGGGR